MCFKCVVSLVLYGWVGISFQFVPFWDEHPSWSLAPFFFERLQVTSQPRPAYRSDPKASQCQILRVVSELPFYYVKVSVTCPVLKAAMYSFLVSSGKKFHNPLAEFQKHEQLQCSFMFFFFISLSLCVCAFVVWCKISSLLHLHRSLVFSSSKILSSAFSAIQHRSVSFSSAGSAVQRKMYIGLDSCGERLERRERERDWKSTIFTWRVAAQRRVQWALYRLHVAVSPLNPVREKLGGRRAFILYSWNYRRSPSPSAIRTERVFV